MLLTHKPATKGLSQQLWCQEDTSQIFGLCVIIDVSVLVLISTQAAKRGLLAPGRGRGVHTRGRGALRSRGRGTRGRGRGVPLHAVVDHRPRALEISGFADRDRVDLLPHFAVSQHRTRRSRQADLISTTEPSWAFSGRRRWSITGSGSYILGWRLFLSQIRE